LHNETILHTALKFQVDRPFSEKKKDRKFRWSVEYEENKQLSYLRDSASVVVTLFKVIQGE